MSSVFGRLRSFSSPRSAIVLLLLGFALQALGWQRGSVALRAQTASVAALDSAIAKAMPAPTDTSTASAERLRDLVSQKRDAELAVRDATGPWGYVSMLGGALVLSAIILGAQALLGHLRGENEA